PPLQAYFEVGPVVDVDRVHEPDALRLLEAHHDAVRAGPVPEEVDPAEQLAARDAGRGEEEPLPGREGLGRPDPVEVGDAHLGRPPAVALRVLDEAALHLAAEAA